MTGLLGKKGGYHAVTDCDVLLMLGTDFAWRQFYPTHATVVQVDVAAQHIGRHHPVTLGLVGDIAPTVRLLLPMLAAKPDLMATGFPCRAQAERFSSSRLPHPVQVILATVRTHGTWPSGDR